MYPLGKTMQLKLNLFKDSLDNYRKGNKLNQELLQTGNPKGTFKKGNTHPNVEGLVFYKLNRKGELWCTPETLQKHIEKKKEWCEQNKEHMSDLGKKWRQENKDYLKEYRKQNKDRINEWHRTRYKNDEKFRNIKKTSALSYYKTEAGRLSNIASNDRYKKTEKYKESIKRYRESEHARVRIRAAANEYRARKQKATVNLTEYEEGEIQQIYAHAVRVSNKLQIPFEVDHIVPLTKGGLHHPDNLQVVPASWNRKKYNSNTERWLPNGM